MREQLIAWAGDCIVRGNVELGEGRLSDQVNELETITFHHATLHALDDGREVELEELEVERGELHVIEVRGRRGDPVRRKRTVEERVALELGPFEVTGNLHRAPSALPMAALTGWARFVPVTDARVRLREDAHGPSLHEVVLVNRERVGKAIPIDAVPVFSNEPPLAPEVTPEPAWPPARARLAARGGSPGDDAPAAREPAAR